MHYDRLRRDGSAAFEFHYELKDCQGLLHVVAGHDR